MYSLNTDDFCTFRKTQFIVLLSSIVIICDCSFTLIPSCTRGDEGETAIADYDYGAQEDNELSFPEGAKIIRIKRIHEDWWEGEYNGQTGLFPGTSSLVTFQ